LRFVTHGMSSRQVYVPTYPSIGAAPTASRPGNPVRARRAAGP
jgi:hypothetical protein